MKEMTLLIHEDATLSTITGAMDMFIHTNSMYQQTGKSQPFKLILAGEAEENNLLPVNPLFVSYRKVAELEKPDLIIVPAFYGDRDSMLKKHRSMIRWINEKYEAGSEIASLCAGIYFLAEAGLLPGRACTA